MLEVAFLILLGLIWIIFAVVQDLKEREIANWLNFSLIIFALGFRLLYSLFESGNYNFFYQGLLGFAFFFVIGNLLYYGRVFAGGDAKLMIALGAVIPFSSVFLINLNFAFLFLFLFLIAGAFYGIIFSLVLGIKNRKVFVKEFIKRFEKKRKIFYLCLFFSLVLVFSSLAFEFFIIIAILIFISPYIYFSAKIIDESCMIKKINFRDLREGDWLSNDLNLGGRKIKASWEGLNKRDILFIRKNKKNVFIRQGIPYSPVFLISYLVLVFKAFF